MIGIYLSIANAHMHSHALPVALWLRVQTVHLNTQKRNARVWWATTSSIGWDSVIVQHAHSSMSTRPMGPMGVEGEVHCCCVGLQVPTYSMQCI